MFTLNNFYLRCSSSLTLSSVPFFLLLSLSIELLFWLLYFISSKISIWFFFLSPAYLLRLDFFICSQYVFNCLLKYFYNGFSKTLSDNSNISSCFRYLSIDFFSSGWDFPVWKQYLVETWTFWVLQYEILDLIHGPSKLALHYSAFLIWASLLAGFFWYHYSKKKERVLHLLLPIRAWGSHSPLVLHGYHASGQGGYASLLLGLREAESKISKWSSLTLCRERELLTTVKESLSPTWPLMVEVEPHFFWGAWLDYSGYCLKVSFLLGYPFLGLMARKSRPWLLFLCLCTLAFLVYNFFSSKSGT